MGPRYAPNWIVDLEQQGPLYGIRAEAVEDLVEHGTGFKVHGSRALDVGWFACNKVPDRPLKLSLIVVLHVSSKIEQRRKLQPALVTLVVSHTPSLTKGEPAGAE